MKTKTRETRTIPGLTCWLCRGTEFTTDRNGYVICCKCGEQQLSDDGAALKAGDLDEE